MLAACRLAGVDAVYRMGGAHAIAALAYGTESVPRVDVIVGPGNLYVQEAKRQVFGQVGIDGFAGPSDLLVLATGDVDPEPLALDLLAQAEHGPGTLVVAASDDARLLDAFDERCIAEAQRADVIVGPGNLYVQEAKRQVFGQVGIDGFAGPSDLLVVATGDVDPEPLALDLLAQAEHGPGTLVVAASENPELLDEFEGRLTHGTDTGAVACLVAAPSADQLIAFAEAFAPEHLQLVGAEAEALADRVTRAGCLFVGATAGTAFGDYIVGSNHILPTNGAARFASAVSPYDFTRHFCEVHIANPAELARAAAPLARAEGFELHARSMEARIKGEWTAAPDGGAFGENGDR